MKYMAHVFARWLLVVLASTVLVGGMLFLENVPHDGHIFAYPLPATVDPHSTPSIAARSAPRVSTPNVIAAYPLPGTPIPMPTSTSTPQGGSSRGSMPTLRSLHPERPAPVSTVARQNIYVVKSNGLLTPTVQVFSTISQTLPPKFSKTIAHPPNTHLPAATITKPATPQSGFVDNWVTLLDDNLEGSWPPQNCYPEQQNLDLADRQWGTDTYLSYSPTHGAWRAASGADRVVPPANYPPNMQTWLVCGTYDLSDAQKFFVQYAFRGDLPDTADFFAFEYTVDNWQTWTSATYPAPPVSQDWTIYTWWLNDLVGSNQVQIAWGFFSNGDDITGQGPWLDDLRIAKYKTPQGDCGNQDTGLKGVAFVPYLQPIPNIYIPIINANDTTSLQHMIESHANWVRLEFQQIGGFVNVQDYDGVIDSLCSSGISTLGLVDYTTITTVGNQDWNSPGSAAAYRQVFSNTVGFLAQYYKGRIKYWEIWNEPDGGPGPISANNYAPLLNNAFGAIRQSNPDAILLSGGLGSAWPDTAFPYFVGLYDELDKLLNAPRPFDVFADHPYPDDRHPISPSAYLYENLSDGPTILQPFLDEMVLRDSATKPVWITEFGWNGDALAPPEKQQCTLITSRTQQAIFLKWGFDILRNEVRLQNGSLAINKLFWFGYTDFSGNTECNGNTIEQASWYGLYSADRAQANQPTQCVFASYPDWGNCIRWNYLYLPNVEQGENPVSGATK